MAKEGKVYNRNIAFSPESTVVYPSKKSGTDASQAITQNSTAGKITSSTTTLAADTTETITLTNNTIKASSIVLASIGGGGAGDVTVVAVEPAAGSCVFKVRNVDASNACNAAYFINYIVMN